MAQTLVVVRPEVTVVMTPDLILVCHHPPQPRWSWADLLKLATLLKPLAELAVWLSPALG